jgi:hypothetical protein
MTVALESLLSNAPPGERNNLIEAFAKLTTIPDDCLNQSTVSEEVCAEGQALADELKQYGKDYYRDADCYKVSVQNVNNSSGLSFTTYAERVNVNNHLSASWRGDWTISGTDLKGSLKLHSYFAEDCNVQLELSKDYSVTLKSADPKATVTKISTIESDLMAELKDLYLEMPDKLKALRRVLPVTKTRLEWNVLSHRMAKKLEETAAGAST